MALAIKDLLSKASAFEGPVKGSGKSKLDPYKDVVVELRKKKATPRQIAEFLKTHGVLTISATAVVNYLKTLEKDKK